MNPDTGVDAPVNNAAAVATPNRAAIVGIAIAQIAPVDKPLLLFLKIGLLIVSFLVEVELELEVELETEALVLLEDELSELTKLEDILFEIVLEDIPVEIGLEEITVEIGLEDIIVEIGLEDKTVEIGLEDKTVGEVSFELTRLIDRIKKNI